MQKVTFLGADKQAHSLFGKLDHMTPTLPLPVGVEKLKAATVMWNVTPACCFTKCPTHTVFR